jgi:putative membrane protein
MTTRLLLATVHLIALGIGLGAVWARARALRGRLDPDGLRRVFHADSWWAVAAVLWIGTGLWRAFGGVEKGTGYYLHNHAFLAKMGMLGVILALEVWPMITLVRWRLRLQRGEIPDTGAAGPLSLISVVQAALVVLMVFAAAAMARGLGAGGG